MKRILVLLIVVLALSITLIAEAEKPTRLYTPIVKQATYTTKQTNTLIWEPTIYESIVMTGYSISSERTDADDPVETITLGASDAIVVAYMASPETVISPGGFLWKGAKDEAIIFSTLSGNPGNVSVTLMGWEETN